jgi:hypothetical protein
VAIAAVTWGVVSQISQVSIAGLESAIIADSGLRGSYTIEFRGGAAGPCLETQREIVDNVATSMDATIMGYWTQYPPVRSECPPFEQLGVQPVRVLTTIDGAVFGLPFGQTGTIATEWCFEGVSVPQSMIYVPGDANRLIFGNVLYVHPDYSDILYLSTTDPLSHGFILVTSMLNDLRQSISEDVAILLAEAAAQSEVPVESLFSISRLDMENPAIQAASQGVAITYALIGFGVLALGSFAVLSSQVISLRHRRWFYGLAAAMGLSRAKTIALFSLETLITLLFSSSVAVTALLILATPVDILLFDTFGTGAQLWSTPVLSSLAVWILITQVGITAAGILVIQNGEPISTLEAPRE